MSSSSEYPADPALGSLSGTTFVPAVGLASGSRITGATLVEKSGAWFSYGDQKIGQGRENVRQYLVEHPELMRELETQIIAKYQKRRKELLEEAARKVH